MVETLSLILEVAEGSRAVAGSELGDEGALNHGWVLVGGRHPARDELARAHDLPDVSTTLVPDGAATAVSLKSVKRRRRSVVAVLLAFPM